MPAGPVPVMAGLLGCLRNLLNGVKIMGAIPDASLPGYDILREKVRTALERGEELPWIDFKESQPWSKLKYNIVKTALGMGNLDDGGIIIIGVSERENNLNFTGIEYSHLKTYDTDEIAEFVDSFVAPYVEIGIVKYSYDDGNDYLIIDISSFTKTPLICKKDGKKGLEEGRIYVRPLGGKPRTTKVMEAQQMELLLERAAEFRARKMIETSERIGALHIHEINNSQKAKQDYSDELGDL